jgi:hypothetical protein
VTFGKIIAVFVAAETKKDKRTYFFFGIDTNCNGIELTKYNKTVTDCNIIYCNGTDKTVADKNGPLEINYREEIRKWV